MLVLGCLSVNAQTLTTETFGGGENHFSIDFVEIGNPGNAADTTGSPNPVGSVAYTYNLGKYEVSRDMITKANAAGSLGITMSDMSAYGGNGINRPATGVSWYEAAQFVNWLNTSTGGVAAYKFVDGTFQLWSAGDTGYNANNLFRNSLAKYVIASRDEWYKAAFGKPDGSWLNSPNPTWLALPPIAVANGTDANTAVYDQTYEQGPADITNAGGVNAFGTMGQFGNVWEWNETAFDGTSDIRDENRVLRGGAWSSHSYDFDAAHLAGVDPTDEFYTFGFRVASVPEPSSLSLLLAGGAVLMAGRRRKS